MCHTPWVSQGSQALRAGLPLHGDRSLAQNANTALAPTLKKTLHFFHIYFFLPILIVMYTKLGVIPPEENSQCYSSVCQRMSSLQLNDPGQDLWGRENWLSKLRRAKFSGCATNVEGVSPDSNGGNDG